MSEPTTIADLVRARAEDDRIGLRFEDLEWSHREVVAECAARAAYLLDHRPAAGPFHVGALFDNTPEFHFWLGGAALAGATLVGINPTRRGEDLAGDISHTDCAFVVTEQLHASLLAEIGHPVAAGGVLVTGSDSYDDALADYHGLGIPDAAVHPADVFVLVFTSGTTGRPKAVVVSQGRLTKISQIMVQSQELTADDVVYQTMPLFHSNALMVGWAPAWAAGAQHVLRRRFSASGFMPDVRRYGVTFFNYVGKPLSYVLATPEQPDDGDNTIRRAFGNEGADIDIERFAERFNVIVQDGYGSSEGGAAISRVPGMPKGSLGRGPEGTCILDPETMEECPAARFDEHGHFLNPDEAIGEIVSKTGAAGFEGYYNNPEADAARTRNGWYWTGDLGYRDADGWFYFAGRDFEWLRVDGENFAAAPVERILARYRDVVLAALYAVPAVDVGDEAMACLLLRPGATFDPADFDDFLDAQRDLGTKMAPRFVRLTDQLPMTETQKILKRVLRRERWECDDQVWWKPYKGGAYQRMTLEDRHELRDEFRARGRESALEAS